MRFMPFLTQMMGLTTLSRISSAVSVLDVGYSPAAKSISLQKTLCRVGPTLQDDEQFVISVCYIANSAVLLLSRVPFDRKA